MTSDDGEMINMASATKKNPYSPMAANDDHDRDQAPDEVRINHVSPPGNSNVSSTRNMFGPLGTEPSYVSSQSHTNEKLRTNPNRVGLK